MDKVNYRLIIGYGTKWIETVYKRHKVKQMTMFPFPKMSCNMR